MKITALTLFIVFCCQFEIKAQIEAITSNGDTVLLFDDGKWDYKNNQTPESVEAYFAKLPVLNPEKFSKPKASKEVAKGKNGAYEIWYNAGKWDRDIKKNQEGSDMEFQRKNGEAYILTIFERAEFPLTTLRDVAINNAESVSSEFEVVKEELRMVNDREVLCLQFNATIKGIKFTYLGYYLTFPEGSLQVLTFSYQNLFKEFEPDFVDFLNGIKVKS